MGSVKGNCCYNTMFGEVAVVRNQTRSLRQELGGAKFLCLEAGSFLLNMFNYGKDNN